MICKLLLKDGLKEEKDNLYKILLINILHILLSKYLHRFILNCKYHQVNFNNKLIYNHNNLLGIHYIMLTNCYTKKIITK